MQQPSTLIEIKMWHCKNEKNILTYDHTVRISLDQMKGDAKCTKTINKETTFTTSSNPSS